MKPASISMFNSSIKILIIILLINISKISAQTTVVFQPHGSAGQDISFGDNPAYLSPDSNLTELGAVQWTCGGAECELMSLLKFDLSSIPANATVIDAKLSLYANTQQLNGNIALGPMYGIDNSSTLYPITSPWSMSTVSWVTMPSFSTSNTTVLQTSTAAYQNYLNINVTSSVSQMVSNPSTNFGWMLRINTPNYYNSMIFCSSNFPDSTKHPVLEVTYITSNCLVVKPNAVEEPDMSFGNNPSYLSPDSNSTDLGSVQWTCGGSPCELRSVLKFDLSAIPAGSIVQYASLSLFSNPQQNNGNPALGPMYGSNNSSELLKITTPWDQASLSWNNQPNTTQLDVVTLNQSTSAYQDYMNIDVTNVVQSWINQPSANYGWMMKLITSSYYNSMIFCSSNFSDTTRHPFLEICLNTVGIVELGNQNPFLVAPTIFDNAFSIHYNGKRTTKTEVHIFDMLGKMHLSETRILNEKEVFTFHTERFSPGVYIVKVMDSGHVYSFKIIKTE